MTSSDGPRPFTAEDLESLIQLYRRLTRDRQLLDLVAEFQRVGFVRYAAGPFVPAGKMISMPESELSHPFVAFATEADAQAFADALSLPLRHIRDAGMKEPLRVSDAPVPFPFPDRVTWWGSFGPAILSRRRRDEGSS